MVWSRYRDQAYGWVDRFSSLHSLPQKSFEIWYPEIFNNQKGHSASFMSKPPPSSEGAARNIQTRVSFPGPSHHVVSYHIIHQLHSCLTKPDNGQARRFSRKKTCKQTTSQKKRTQSSFLYLPAPRRTKRKWRRKTEKEIIALWLSVLVIIVFREPHNALCLASEHDAIRPVLLSAQKTQY